MAGTASFAGLDAFALAPLLLFLLDMAVKRAAGLWLGAV